MTRVLATMTAKCILQYARLVKYNVLDGAQTFIYYRALYFYISWYETEGFKRMDACTKSRLQTSTLSASSTLLLSSKSMHKTLIGKVE